LKLQLTTPHLTVIYTTANLDFLKESNFTNFKTNH